VERSPHFVFAVAVVVASVFALALAAAFAFLVVIPEGNSAVARAFAFVFAVALCSCLVVALAVAFAVVSGVERGFSPASKPATAASILPKAGAKAKPQRLYIAVVLAVVPPSRYPESFIPLRINPQKYSLHPDHPNRPFHHNYTTQIPQANAQTR
jgi:hypothetical protein